MHSGPCKGGREISCIHQRDTEHFGMRYGRERLCTLFHGDHFAMAEVIKFLVG